MHRSRRSSSHPSLSGLLGAAAALGLLLTAASPAAPVSAATLLSATFDADAEGFTYVDDPFLGTSEPAYADGGYDGAGGFSGGGLAIELGGVDNSSVTGISGGWSVTVNLAGAVSGASLSFRYRLTQSPDYEFDELSRVYVSLDGTLVGRGPKDYVDHVGGDGVSGQGNSSTYEPTTGWRQQELYLGDLAAGDHTIVLGGYNNAKTQVSEYTEILLDDVVLSSDNEAPAASDAERLADRANEDSFLGYIQSLASFDDRCRLSSCGPDYSDFEEAQAWAADELEAMGYEPVLWDYSEAGTTGTNLWVTKEGSVDPDEMYIVSAHMDGRGGGDAFDDDGSGSGAVLEMARLFAASDVVTEKSVRFIWWDQEEAGLIGSEAYAGQRASLQGTAGEPTWLGLITHDMILYDHGAGSPSAGQSAFADMDVEFRAGTDEEAASRELALAWHDASGIYAGDYPSTAYSFSTNTDDTPFHDLVASVSVRENRRNLTSGGNAEWINPHYHQTSDVEASYSSDDIALGYDILRTTTGLVAELSGASLTSDALPFQDDFSLDAGWTIDPEGRDTARDGQWERGVAEPTFSFGPKQLRAYSGSYDLVTGALAGPSADSNDLDRGVTTARSPSVFIPEDGRAALSMKAYFAHARNATKHDYLRIRAVGSGTEATLLELRGRSANIDGAWKQVDADLGAFAGQLLYLEVEAADLDGDSLVEAAIDDVHIRTYDPPPPLLSATFDADAEGFGYVDDPFRGSAQPAYADGAWAADGGREGGGLTVTLGGQDNWLVREISGGWSKSFNLGSAAPVTVSLWIDVTQSPDYDRGEWSQSLVSVDGTLLGIEPNDYVAQVEGNGNGGIPETSGWVLFSKGLGTLSAGAHELILGGYNNRKSWDNEVTTVRIDDVMLMTE